VVAKVRGILRANLPQDKRKSLKVGHAGTLDPLAKGVLLILTGADTKKQTELLKLEKEYVGEISFGITSPTYDLEGDLTYHQIPQNFNLKTVLKPILNNYLGEIEQKVPPYSAVKKDGKVLYKEARKGKLQEKDLPVKKVTIHNIKINNYYEKEGLPAVNLTITCGKGTYIRSLAHDLGRDLGVGAVLTNLVRTRIGNYTADKAIRIRELENRLKM
jgi:tRNA pseudouridine55 synthase